MFRSARLKLTLFYLAVLLVFCLTLTLGFRVFADAEYGHSNHAQSLAVHRIFFNRFDEEGVTAPSPSSFVDAQADEASAWQAHLDRDLALVNIYALVIGGLLSYWFADRTLKPIEAAHEAQKRFATDASHELRTPLTNLRLENEIFLRQKHFDEADARALITSNLEEVQRLQQLSTTLLDLTQYGQAALALGSVGTEHIVDAAVHQAQPAAKLKHSMIVKEAGQTTVLGHHDSLVQLLGILLDNAVKYGAENGRITIHGQRRGKEYILQVIDDGPGIAPADLPHIFERLYRGDKARTGKTSGYGLGLSLAQEIAHANHSHLTAKNNADGHGACFEFRLEVA